jgi:hypothetical protein
VRAIISKGWSARMSKGGDEEVVVFPEECYSVRSRAFVFVLLVLMFVYSWTKYRMSELFALRRDRVSVLTTLTP